MSEVEVPKPQEVNIRLGDEMSEYFTEASKLTWEIRPDCLDLSGVSFGSPALIDGDYFYRGDNHVSFGHQLDGIGTKPEISERLNEHSGSAYDLFAMVADDAAASGGEVISIDNILDVRVLDEDNEVIISGMHQLAEGMVNAAYAAGVVVLSGEIAELGRRIGGYGDFNYNWGGVAFVAVNKERKLTGAELQAGHALVGFVEPGFRSNGITDVRNAMLEHYGENWHEQVETSLGNISLGKLMQTPSTIYAKLMRDLQGGFDRSRLPRAEVTGVAHITGGGQPSKLGRMLRRTNGLGIVVDNPIEPPEMMKHVQMLRGFDDRKAYGKWHMGPGMIVATTEPEKVIEGARDYGITAKKIGEVTDEPGIRIRNRGAKQDSEWLVYPEAA
jgi:phosphoribosylformylglycinamidine cyclo-ligase